MLAVPPGRAMGGVYSRRRDGCSIALMNPTRRDTPFREAMRSLLVFDGAMGSLLYERGIFVMQNFEQLNVTRPDVVTQDPRGLRRRRRPGHRDQHLRRQHASASTATGSATRSARSTSPAPGSRGRRRARTCGSPARSAPPGSSRAWPPRPSWTRPSRRSPSRRRRSWRAAPTCSCSRRSATWRRSAIAVEAARRVAPGHADHRLDGLRRRRRPSPTGRRPEQRRGHAARLGRRR